MIGAVRGLFHVSGVYNLNACRAAVETAVSFPVASAGMPGGIIKRNKLLYGTPAINDEVCGCLLWCHEEINNTPEVKSNGIVDDDVLKVSPEPVDIDVG
ncbi:hypothetical protein MBAV_005002 [Candidatus Magnetobacterium bavaricum]|uniref:Uncharacterized protein n=1 Tax=Candidatus Magnetobacterium bavaricum TaxID=29290 RepID=A0A0F3GLW4_9BACT|nr:hypothetical protein MBAV_005002 [Candidatus Magnetobacterium bavaricum]